MLRGGDRNHRHRVLNSHRTPAALGDRTAADQPAGISEWHFSTLFDASLKLSRMRNTIPRPAFFKICTHTDVPLTEHY